MHSLSRIRLVIALGLAGLAAACGASRPPTPAAVDSVGTQVAEARAVAATLTALAPSAAGGTPLPSVTPAPDEGSAAGAGTPTAPSGPAPTAACSVQAAGLRLRPGPGTVYEPPLAVLTAGTALEPVAFATAGFPEGQWVQVRVTGSNLVGWVSAAPQLVACTVSLAGLPTGAIPPTPTPGAPPVPPSPTPSATATPAPVAYVNIPVAGDNGDLKGNLVAPAGLALKLKPLTFHDHVVFEVRVRDPGAADKQNGGGIASVEFSITNENGDEVLHHIEKSPAFCPFGNSGPPCDVWWFKDHGNKWPKGQPAQPGRYQVQINIQPAGKDRRGANWNFDLVLQ